jgi:hypothetical protein
VKSKLQQAIDELHSAANASEDSPDRKKARRALAAFYGSKAKALSSTAAEAVRAADERHELAVRMGVAAPIPEPRVRKIGGGKIVTFGGGGR